MPFTIINLIAFSVDIWGTVSDWVTVVVTLASVIMLYITLVKQSKNLAEQSELFKQQSKLFEIEQKRYFKQIRPRPELKLKTVSPWDYYLEFFMHDNAAYNLTVTISKMVSVKMPDNPDNLALPFKVFNTDQSWQLHFELDPPAASEQLIDSIEIDVKCIFENEIGVTYEQEFRSIAAMNFTSTPPQIVES